MRQRIRGLEDSLDLCNRQKADLPARVTELGGDVDIVNEKCRRLGARRVQEDVYDRIRAQLESYGGVSGDEEPRPPSYHAVDPQGDDDEWWRSLLNNDIVVESIEGYQGRIRMRFGLQTDHQPQRLVNAG